MFKLSLSELFIFLKITFIVPPQVENELINFPPSIIYQFVGEHINLRKHSNILATSVQRGFLMFPSSIYTRGFIQERNRFNARTVDSALGRNPR